MNTSFCVLFLAATFSLISSFGLKSDAPASGSSGMVSCAHPLDVRQAIAAGRISLYEPDELGVEESTPLSVPEQLSKLGHKIRVVPGIGNAHGLTIAYDSAHKPVRFTGAADPRGNGKAIGY